MDNQMTIDDWISAIDTRAEVDTSKIHMRVLSLFDGMACGHVALNQLGIIVDNYDSYEIDKHAIKTAQHNFPALVAHGDVFAEDFSRYKGQIDLLCGGSPCTYWSIAQTKNRETVASGIGWELFSQYVRALREAQPKYFLYENNKSMSADIRASISETFGFEPICINSALVSAQNRQRLYWCGVRQNDGTYKKADIRQPEDRHILLKDILETNSVTCIDKAYTYTTRCHAATIENTLEKHQHAMVAQPVNITDEDKSHTLKAQYYKNGIANFVTNNGFDATAVAEPVCVAQRGRYSEDSDIEQQYEVKDDHKTNALTTVTKDNLIAEPIRVGTMPSPGCKSSAPIYEVKDGMITVKDKKYPIKLYDGHYIIRKLTVRECMRLQQVPEWYDFSCTSNSQAYKMLGNGWSIEVIMHLIRGLLTTE